MTELYFMRHGQRIDHALELDPQAKPLFPDYQPYDPSLSTFAESQISQCCDDILDVSQAFHSPNGSETIKKNIFIHFSPYLRCCQTSDLLITFLKSKIEQKFPNYKMRFQLLGDFALSEWIHDKMKNKPPFMDSNDAYQMYTPNIKILKNRSACSNFRPCISLGHYNGYDLSYKDYQDNCKEYFKKLLATYDKPSYIKNEDIIIVVSHGYMINNILSYFVNHPIFDEIPEAKINFARKVVVEDNSEDISMGDDTTGTENTEGQPKYNWVLEKDALDMFNFAHIDTSLNLDSDIVYYKTNFIKRDELNPDKSVVMQKKEDKPRASFKIPHTSQSYQIEAYQMSHDFSLNLDSESSKPIKSTKDNYRNSNVINNPICPAAKDWSPQKLNTFLIKNEFKLKMMNTDVFKRDFDISNPPKKPVTPEVSPCSEPTRNNSVIDLSKLSSNEDYRPMKLRYSTTGDIPLQQLNQKVNSQVNLAQFQRSNPSSNNSSTTDFPRFLTSSNKRAISNPAVSNRDHSSPKVLSTTFSNESLYEDIDFAALDTNDLDIIKEARNTNMSYTNSNHSPVANPLLSRSKSAKYKQELAMNNGKSLLALYQKQQSMNSSSDDEEKFTLSFKKDKAETEKARPSTHKARSRKNSIKFIPSLNGTPLTGEVIRESNSTPVGFYTKPNSPPKSTPARPQLVQTKSKSMFYNLDSDTDSNMSLSSDEEEKPTEKLDYDWFGQNRAT